MRTLALLAGLLLLALHGRAEPLEETADQVMEPEDHLATRDLAGAEDEDEDVAASLDEDEDEDEDERLARDVAGMTCRCRRRTCRYGEMATTNCVKGGLRFIRCCKS